MPISAWSAAALRLTAAWASTKTESAEDARGHGPHHRAGRGAARAAPAARPSATARVWTASGPSRPRPRASAADLERHAPDGEDDEQDDDAARDRGRHELGRARLRRPTRRPRCPESASRLSAVAPSTTATARPPSSRRVAPAPARRRPRAPAPSCVGRDDGGHDGQRDAGRPAPPAAQGRRAEPRRPGAAASDGRRAHRAPRRPASGRGGPAGPAPGPPGRRGRPPARRRRARGPAAISRQRLGEHPGVVEHDELGVARHAPAPGSGAASPRRRGGAVRQPATRPSPARASASSASAARRPGPRRRAATAPARPRAPQAATRSRPPWGP